LNHRVILHFYLELYFIVYLGLKGIVKSTLGMSILFNKHLEGNELVLVACQWLSELSFS
jgi:hypothetical protein